MSDTLGCLLFECARMVEALEHLWQAQFRVVACEETLPDGDWTTLLAEMGTLPYRLGMVVVSDSADCRQRVEALRREGQELMLAAPQHEEIRRVVNVAAAKGHLARTRVNAGLRKPSCREESEEVPGKLAAGDG